MNSPIDTTYYDRCIQTLERAYEYLLKSNPSSIEFYLYRSACVKEFEIVLKQSGKLMRKTLKPYFHTSQAVDRLFFNDVFRQAVQKSLISLEACERLLTYRLLRNTTAHEYGAHFAQDILLIIPEFLSDSKHLLTVFQAQDDASSQQG